MSPLRQWAPSPNFVAGNKFVWNYHRLIFRPFSPAMNRARYIKKFWYLLLWFIAQPHEFSLCRRKFKDKYASIKFCLYLYRINEHFRLFSKLLYEKRVQKQNIWKSKKGKNERHFISIIVFGKWRQTLIFRMTGN